MNHFIKVGGFSVILAVALIFVFILWQILPLFRGASVEYDRTVDLGDIEIASVGIDRWSELPMFVEPDGTLNFLDIMDPEADYNRGLFTIEPDLDRNLEFPFSRFNQRHGRLLLGTDDGRFAIVSVDFDATHPRHRSREVVPRVTTSPLFRIGGEAGAFRQMDYVDAGRSKLAVVIQEKDGQRELYALTFRETQPLVGDPVLTRGNEWRLSQLFEGQARFLRVTGDTDFVIVGTDEDEVHLLARERSGFKLRQTVRPFKNFSNEDLQSMDFLFGDLSLIFTNTTGDSVMYTVYHDEEQDQRILGHAKTFDPLPTGRGADIYSSSLRNKGYLMVSDRYATVRYATTEQTRWDSTLHYDVRHALLGGRYNKLAFVDTANQLHLYDLRDPHPETGLSAYFSRIHYEGRAAPEYMWQSTGGGDEFEPKLSMVPLIIGTMKGTFYAMIFAVPIALLAALYTSQFLRPEFRRVVKPTMEIMESVPTVVLGFLAALWLAPLLSGSVPSFLLLCVSLPVAALALGFGVEALPRELKRWIKPGWEFAYFAPVMFLTAWGAWSLGPILEGLLFVVENPNNGEVVVDFRLWWESATPWSFEQRNSMVVGFLMGFAIIPTIFTIAEDSMSNVPASFRSGSLALGASRWQTAVRVVLPTAAAGIFSALMIGFGRAVGETMIVLMATGNTPVMNFNIFEGMRTLSANIAVELPEAAEGGSLYRSLYLGAMLLFLMTFFVNTLAEILRQRLRDRYKAVE